MRNLLRTLIYATLIFNKKKNIIILIYIYIYIYILLYLYRIVKYYVYIFTRYTQSHIQYIIYILLFNNLH